MRAFLCALALAACSEADVEPCDESTNRAHKAGPFRCEGEPAFVNLGDFDIFTYEASHPEATASQAFPCAASQGVRFEAPDETTEACSRAGVRPWHTVRWSEAARACEEIGWRLCSGAELTRACSGPRGNAYVWGSNFEQGVCNFREGYTPPGERFATEAPSGTFEACVTDEGVADANGNLWEWNGDHAYQGAGWRTIAESHRDGDLVCTAKRDIPETLADYATYDVGFRCCRDAR